MNRQDHEEQAKIIFRCPKSVHLGGDIGGSGGDDDEQQDHHNISYDV